MKTVVEEEDRSRSLMIFGLPENKGEDEDQLNAKVNELLQEVGEKPKIDATRIRKSSGENSKIVICTAIL